MPWHSHGLQLETQAKLPGYWPGLNLNMEQKLWPLAFALALLRTRPNLFHGEMGHWQVRRGPPSFYIINKVNHGTPSAREGLRKYFSS